MTWRKDMENAPRDRKILAGEWRHEARVWYFDQAVIWWSQSWQWCGFDLKDPTHWQHLPEPPTDERVEP